MSPVPVPASPSDFEPIVALLRGADLPIADFTPGHLVNFQVVHADENLVAAVGLEVHADAALLRSLVVAVSHHRLGLGTGLVAAAEAQALLLGLSSLTLLTTTAAAFFARLGYRRIDRDAASAELRSSSEFAHLCPTSAMCMSKALPRP